MLGPGSASHQTTSNNLLRGTTLLAFERSWVILFGFGFLFVIIRHLGPEAYGIYIIGFAVVTFAYLFTGNAELALERFLPQLLAEHHGTTARRLFSSILVLNVVLATIVSAGLWVLASLIARFYDIAELGRVIQILSVLVLTRVLQATTSSTFLGLQAFGMRTLTNGAKAGTDLLAVIIAASVGMSLNETMLVLVLASIASVLPGAVLAGLVLRHRSTYHDEARDQQEPLFPKVARYVIPMSGSQVLSQIYQQMGKLILGFFFGALVAGYFGLAFTVVEYSAVMLAVVGSAMLPEFSRLRGLRREDLIGLVFPRAYRFLTLAGCLSGLAFFVLAGDIVAALGGSDFGPAVSILQILALQPVFRISSQAVVTLYQTYERTNLVLLLGALKIAADFALYGALIPAFEANGAATAHVMSYFLVLMLAAYGLRFFTAPMLAKLTRASLPFYCSIAAALSAAVFLDYFIDGAVGSALRGMLVFGVFALALVMTGGLTTSDVRALRSARTGIRGLDWVKDEIIDALSVMVRGVRSQPRAG